MEILERQAPSLFCIRYFGAEARLMLEAVDGGTELTVECRCDDPTEWLEFHAGWVSWLLVLKGVAEHGIDLRNRRPGRGWVRRFVDQ